MFIYEVLSACLNMKKFIKYFFYIKKNKYYLRIYLFGICIYNSLKRVLFINPENHFFEESNPIAILDIAQYLRYRGIKVDVCEYKNLPINSQYDLIGISCVSSYGGEIFNQLEKIRKNFPFSKIVIGGKWSTTMLPEDKIKLKTLNINVEINKAELVYTGDEKIDFKKYPSWNKKDFDILYKRDQIMTSRGCPFNCNFCNNTEEKINYFSVKRTVDNIELVLQKRENVYFVDDVFVTNFEHAKSIYDECKRRNINIENHNHFFVHLNTVNENTIKLIQLYKPNFIEVGIESGDDRILKLMNKKTSTDKIRKTLPLLSKYTQIYALWIVGYPYETIESLENSYKLAVEMQQYIEFSWVSHYIPLFGTEGYKMAKKSGGQFLEISNNKTISFIPKGLTSNTLIEYRKRIMELNKSNYYFKKCKMEDI